MRRLVGDELWDAVELLSPPEPPKPKGERPRDPARIVLEVIVHVLRSQGTAASPAGGLEASGG